MIKGRKSLVGRSTQIEEQYCEHGLEGNEKHYQRAAGVWAGGVGEGPVHRGEELARQRGVEPASQIHGEQ